MLVAQQHRLQFCNSDGRHRFDMLGLGPRQHTRHHSLSYKTRTVAVPIHGVSRGLKYWIVNGRTRCELAEALTF